MFSISFSFVLFVLYFGKTIKKNISFLGRKTGNFLHQNENLKAASKKITF